MSEGTSYKSIDERRSVIRRAAVTGALAVGWVALVFGLLARRGSDQACSGAAAVTLSGLLVWTTYHVISRRDDGLFLVMLPLPPIMIPEHHLGFVPTLGICILVQVPAALLLGIFVRRTMGKPSAHASSEPLQDDELDGVV